jgi:hypothetical protein
MCSERKAYGSKEGMALQGLRHAESDDSEIQSPGLQAVLQGHCAEDGLQEVQLGDMMKFAGKIVGLLEGAKVM